MNITFKKLFKILNKYSYNICYLEVKTKPVYLGPCLTQVENLIQTLNGVIC